LKEILSLKEEINSRNNDLNNERLRNEKEKSEAKLLNNVSLFLYFLWLIYLYKLVAHVLGTQI
jgi:hypothetical protein